MDRNSTVLLVVGGEGFPGLSCPGCQGSLCAVQGLEPMVASELLFHII